MSCPTRGHRVLLLDTTLPFRETRSSSINQNTGTSSSNQEIITGHYPTPLTGEDSTTKKYDLENIFFFLIYHIIDSLYIFLPLHYPFVVLWSFHFCFPCLKIPSFKDFFTFFCDFSNFTFDIFLIL